MSSLRIGWNRSEERRKEGDRRFGVAPSPYLPSPLRHHGIKTILPNAPG